MMFDATVAGRTFGSVGGATRSTSTADTSVEALFDGLPAPDHGRRYELHRWRGDTFAVTSPTQVLESKPRRCPRWTQPAPGAFGPCASPLRCRAGGALLSVEGRR
jgi:hypothetical protein